MTLSRKEGAEWPQKTKYPESNVSREAVLHESGNRTDIPATSLFQEAVQGVNDGDKIAGDSGVLGLDLVAAITDHIGEIVRSLIGGRIEMFQLQEIRPDE